MRIIASKHSAKKAKGLNYDNPDTFSSEEIQEIFDIKLEDEFARRLNKNEKIFLEIGGYQTDSLDVLPEIKDYLTHQEIVTQPGDLFKHIEVNLNDVEDIMDKFWQLNMEQRNWHREAAKAQCMEWSRRVSLFCPPRDHLDGHRAQFQLSKEKIEIHGFGDGALRHNQKAVAGAGEGRGLFPIQTLSLCFLPPILIVI